MKKQLIAMVSLVGTLSVLSACTSNEDITFPAMISPLALDVETCSSQAKSDFQSGVAAYKDKKYAQSFELFTKASENNCANADFYLAAQYYNGQHISKNLGVAKEKFKQACHKGLKTACIME